MSLIELIAASLGVLAVWLTIRQNLWCWPIGLVMVLIYSWIFYDVKLYSDMLLQGIYAVGGNIRIKSRGGFFKAVEA